MADLVRAQLTSTTHPVLREREQPADRLAKVVPGGPRHDDLAGANPSRVQKT
ncbi:hypothetical protein [Streptomyces sp. TBY4]|uniref:hypothetical protein n=1 Tax=Streptomyces sp. TBY4 TaxID=2962030 RepID=UPI0020B6F770|nr:hypothetical protein [Streptomyces sp. TBY4]MCP3754544.1 hypothetical protein [Streptomyces sp. TBY4]